MLHFVLLDGAVCVGLRFKYKCFLSFFLIYLFRFSLDLDTSKEHLFHDFFLYILIFRNTLTYAKYATVYVFRVIFGLCWFRSSTSCPSRSLCIHYDQMNQIKSALPFCCRLLCVNFHTYDRLMVSKYNINPYIYGLLWIIYMKHYIFHSFIGLLLAITNNSLCV